jgi:NAD(P)-dependent dehydrogenase (short-subunit alcohol dehydrogenase family)
MAAAGAKVALAGTRVEALEAVRAEIGANAVVCAGDLGDAAATEKLFKDAEGALGQVDILVNNAGIFYAADFLTTPFEDWHRAVDVMFYGATKCSRAAAQQMVAQGGGGQIVNISSVNAFLGAPLSSHYNTAKGAIDQLTRCLAVELAPHRILVNGVAPGFVETPMAVVDGVNEHSTQDFKQFYVQRRRIPLARPAEPDEIATVVTFLAEGTATYLTGHTIVVDGGLSVTF